MFCFQRAKAALTCVGTNEEHLSELWLAQSCIVATCTWNLTLYLLIWCAMQNKQAIILNIYSQSSCPWSVSDLFFWSKIRNFVIREKRRGTNLSADYGISKQQISDNCKNKETIMKFANNLETSKGVKWKSLTIVHGEQLDRVLFHSYFFDFRDLLITYSIISWVKCCYLNLISFVLH